jgi:tRNA(adenine34) deaminase
MTEREENMTLALALAREAAEHGEVPVGCVITGPDGAVLGRGRNRREETGDATAHAELEAIREACAALGDWRLEGCTLTVTLEPCPMCTGAIINARIPTVVFGAREKNFGSCGSVIDLFSERYGHRPAVYPGVLREDCAALLRDFFSGKRQTGAAKLP